jgi:alcohol dehydrogenase class IV
LCSVVLGHVAMGLHHKLCHTLGGTFNLPHADTHTVVLPHALAYNAIAAPQAMARIAQAMGARGGDALTAASAMHAFAARLGAPTALREIGMPAAGLDRAADLAVQTPYPNPRALNREALRALLQRAYDGAPPQG